MSISLRISRKDMICNFYFLGIKIANEQSTRILMFDVAKRSTYFIRSFIKTQSLTEDLFCTGEIETLDYCMEVYQQFINEEELDLFISDSQELKLALTKLRDKPLNFEFYLDELLVTLYFFLPKKNIKKI